MGIENNHKHENYSEDNDDETERLNYFKKIEKKETNDNLTCERCNKEKHINNLIDYARHLSFYDPANKINLPIEEWEDHFFKCKDCQNTIRQLLTMFSIIEEGKLSDNDILEIFATHKNHQINKKGDHKFYDREVEEIIPSIEDEGDDEFYNYYVDRKVEEMKPNIEVFRKEISEITEDELRSLINRYGRN